ncbi:MAG: L-aspartate oxidase, partial [Candidatus Muiribacteriaceae bacterium]
KWLEERGVVFEDTPTKEAAHSYARVLHIGDITGREIYRGLMDHIRRQGLDIEFRKGFVTELIVEEREVCGAVIFDEGFYVIKANAVVLATGGIGAIFANTSNSDMATGDGIALAWRAGATLYDVEFIQFHPTVFSGDSRRFLLSEALRGEGGRIIDENGREFLYDYDPKGELAPRDIVSLSIMEHMEKNDLQNVFLDMTALEPDYLRGRFPTLFSYCLDEGIDMSKEPIPVRPAAHYYIGGIHIDKNCRTDIRRLLACGECAWTGVHGANRLASNSLLECIVFGIEAAHTACCTDECLRDITCPAYSGEGNIRDVSEKIARLRDMNEHSIGVKREDRRIEEMLALLEKERLSISVFPDVDSLTYRNMLDVSYIIARACLSRQESRGVHHMTDHIRTEVRFDGHTSLNREELKFDNID